MYIEKMKEMTTPEPSLIDDVRKIDDDILILGAGGKIGPGLAITAARAQKLAATGKRTIALSIFSSRRDVQLMQEAGVEVIEIDLSAQPLPDDLKSIRSIIYMIGRKFGTTGAEHATWMTNAVLPALLFDELYDKRVVVFSTGNIYAQTPVASRGSRETDVPDPIGEYAQSCLARERIFEAYAERNRLDVLLFRLNYAIDYRYGVLFDIGRAVRRNQAVALDQGYFNCIWQGDVYAYAIRSLLHAKNPARALNVTGKSVLSVRTTAEYFAKRFKTDVSFTGKERKHALLSDASKMIELLGEPKTSLDQMLDRVAAWIEAGQETIDAPTHFEEVDGKY